MSANSGIRPLTSTGVPWLQVKPSGLVLRNSTGLVQPTAVLALYSAQNSFRLGIHWTSRCQGQRSLASITTVVASDQCSPSMDRRTSTAVLGASQPSGPEFTDHMYQSPGPRR